MGDCIQNSINEKLFLNDLCNGLDDDAFCIVDLRKVIQQCQLWVNQLPHIRPFYAVKCFPNRRVVKTIANYGNRTFGFDCACKKELEMVLDCGISPDRIIYAHPCKPVSFLKYAQERNVSLMTFDNEDELRNIKRYFPNAKLVLRVAVPDAKSAFPLEKKFGVDPKPEALTPILKLIQELQLNLVGVSFHVGCDASDPQAFATAIQLALGVIITANEFLGKSLEIVDIGGGFPRNSIDLFQNIANSIKSVEIPSQLSTMSEPGRFFVGTCMSVYATIFGKRLVKGVFHYHINDGYFGNLGFDAVRYLVPIPVKKRKYIDDEALEISNPEDKTGWKESKVWGPTCDSMDVVVNSCLLPELQIGDRICFREVGAYTTTFSTDFCGFKNDRILYFE